DGGTRCASITGAWVAAHDAVAKLVASGALPASPIRDQVAAVSVGIYQGLPVLDLDYDEDSNCDTDLNVVMTGAGGFVDIQGTVAREPFGGTQLDRVVGLAGDGIARMVALQRAAIAS